MVDMVKVLELTHQGDHRPRDPRGPGGIFLRVVDLRIDEGGRLETVGLRSFVSVGMRNEIKEKGEEGEREQRRDDPELKQGREPESTSKREDEEGKRDVKGHLKVKLNHLESGSGLVKGTKVKDGIGKDLSGASKHNRRSAVAGPIIRITSGIVGELVMGMVHRLPGAIRSGVEEES